MGEIIQLIIFRPYTSYLSFWMNLYMSYLPRPTCHSGRICTRSICHAPTCHAPLVILEDSSRMTSGAWQVGCGKWNVYRFFQNDKWGVASMACKYGVASGTCTDSSRMTSGAWQVGRGKWDVVNGTCTDSSRMTSGAWQVGRGKWDVVNRTCTDSSRMTGMAWQVWRASRV